MQDRKHPLKKLSGTQVWFRQDWLWNVETGLPEILKAGPWNHVRLISKMSSLGEGHIDR